MDSSIKLKKLKLQGSSLPWVSRSYDYLWNVLDRGRETKLYSGYLLIKTFLTNFLKTLGEKRTCLYKPPIVRCDLIFILNKYVLCT